jgi:serine phosphatase RsbU (regulator of sigma subunit)
MALLEVVEGAKPFCHNLDEDITIIGRHPDCALTFLSKTVSGIHAKIVKRELNFYIEDLQSRNGVWVNDQPVREPTRLIENDQIRLGEIVLRFKESIPFKFEFTAGAEDETKITAMVPGAGQSGLCETQPEAKLKAVLDISSGLAGTMDLHLLLPKILDSLFQIFPRADRACILLRDETTGKMVSRAIKSRGPGLNECVRLSRTILNKVLAEKTGILSADASTDTQFGDSQTIVDLSIRSLMCVPMLGLDGEPLGVINVDCQHPVVQFCQDDLELLMAVAGQAALSYENARLLSSYVEKKKQDKELAIARNVQRALLPKSFPSIKGYEFHACYDPALAVGGDYYDCFMLGNETICLTLGDVAGKGVPSALIMTWLSSCVQTTLRFVHEADWAAIAINEQMCSRIVEGRFVTFVLMIIDLRMHELSLVNAGHMSPLIRKSDGALELMDEDIIGPPFGVDEGYVYSAEKRSIDPGDTIAIVTDGIFEARNPDGEFYGIERIYERVRQDGSKPARLAKVLLEDVYRHASGRSQTDDITILTIGRSR